MCLFKETFGINSMQIFWSYKMQNILCNLLGLFCRCGCPGSGEDGWLWLVLDGAGCQLEERVSGDKSNLSGLHVISPVDGSGVPGSKYNWVVRWL